MIGFKSCSNRVVGNRSDNFATTTANQRSFLPCEPRLGIFKDVTWSSGQL